MEDAWCHIFDQLQAEDIASCRLVCRNWKHWITRSKRLNRFISVDKISITKKGNNPVEYLVTKYFNHKTSNQYSTSRIYSRFEDIWKFSTKKLVILQISEDAIETVEMGLLRNKKWLRDIKKLYYSNQSALLPNILASLISLEKLTLFAGEETLHLSALLKNLPPLKKIELFCMEEQYSNLADDSTLDILSKSSQVVPLKVVGIDLFRKQFSFAAVKNFLEKAKFDEGAEISLGILDVTINEFHNYMRSKLPESLQTGKLYESYCNYHKYRIEFWYDEWKINANGERQFAFKFCEY